MYRVILGGIFHRLSVALNSLRCNIGTEPGEDSTLLNGKINNGGPGVEHDFQSSGSEDCKVYRSRWYVLFVLVLTSIVSNMMWNTWSPIQRPCRFVFSWERWTLLLLSSFGAIGPILGAFPTTWLMDVKGLRISLLVTSLMLLVGKAIQLIPFHDIKLRTVMIFFGHLVTMLPSCVANGAPPLVSSTWFPPNERTTATAIGALAANFGTALAFIVGPKMVIGDFSDNWKGPRNNFTKQDVESSIINYFYVQTGLAALLFTFIVSYLPDKPPSPPSVVNLTRTSTRISYIDGGRMLLRNGPFWLLAVGFAFSFGIYFGWTSVLDLAVEPFGVSEVMSGWLGTGTSLAGIITGIIIARSADVLKRWTKTILLGLYIGTVVMQLLFALSCSRILPFSRALLFVSIIFSGLFFNGTIPLLFELIMECVFPVGEGTSVGVGLLLGNAVILLFDVTFMFPVSDVRWMNWVCAGGIAVCIPLIAFSKTQYQRLNLETN